MGDRVDFQVISYAGAADVSSVDIIGSDLMDLRIRGGPFRDITSVRINGQEVKFVTTSSTEIIAEIPPSQVRKPLRSLDVRTATASSRKSFVEFVRGSTPLVRSELTYLTQQFLAVLLSDPGSDIFNPELGVGLQSNIFGVSTAEEARSEVVIALGLAIAQLESTRLPEAPALTGADLLSCTFDRDRGTIFAEVQLSTESGAVVSGISIGGQG
jgi:hypothetical protein